MTQDQIEQYDLYRSLIDRAVAEETEATAAMADYNQHVATANDYRAQAQVIATSLGFT
jgi:hypothetical protein